MIRQINEVPKDRQVSWFTPSHGLWVVGVEDNRDTYYVASRGIVPHFILTGLDPGKLDKEAGRFIRDFLKKMESYGFR